MPLSYTKASPHLFRILQFTDLHLRTFPFHAADQKTLQMIAAICQKEKPDLVLFTGDIIWASVAKDPLAIFQAFGAFVNGLHAPIALTYGNHDAKASILTRSMLRKEERRIKKVADKKCSFLAQDRESYVLEIYSADQARLLHLLFVLDSGAYAKSPYSHYDWILPEQIDWFKQTSHYYQKYTAAQDAYVFLHIPLPEFQEAYRKKHPKNSVPGSLRFDAPDLNTGFFSALLFDPLVRGVFAGHNHDNNFHTQYLGLEVAFGQVSGYGAIRQDAPGARIFLLGDQKGPSSFQTSILYGSEYLDV